MPFLNDVLHELSVVVVAKQEIDGEWLLMIGYSGDVSFPSPLKQSAYIYCEDPDNPEISDEEADALRRRFTPPPSHGSPALPFIR
jgi:hypothetical protein